jgi:transcriptional regulator with XRE-family HTH domain
LEFSDALVMIMNILGITGKELAVSSGLDASTISRFRKGYRRPPQDSAQMQRLLAAFCRLAEDQGKTEQIMQLRASGSASTMFDVLKSLLCRESDDINAKRPSVNPSQNDFGRRLTSVMKLLQLSNSMLAKRLNVDASLISRYKSGMRTPANDSALIEELGRYIVSRAETHNQTASLYALMNIDIRTHKEDLVSTVRAWLSFTHDQKANSQAISSMLENIDNLTFNTGVSIPTVNALIPESIRYDRCSTYVGISGLQKAIHRFLGNAAIKELPEELLLYSDQGMEWITENPDFAKLWGALMVTVLSGGKHIKIIHNIGRETPEMLAGISMWLPMYATGLVSPYYCKSVLGKRFQHTMFISGAGAIVGSSVSGSADDAFYHYVTDPAVIQCCISQYERLMKKSEQFVRVYTEENRIDYLNERVSFFNGIADVMSYSPCASILTMPDTLLNKIIRHNRLSSAETEYVLNNHSKMREGLFETLKSRSYTEIVSLPSDLMLSNQQSRFELATFNSNLKIYCTKDEYLEHMSTISDLLKAEQNYHFHPLPSPLFRNIEILQKAGAATLITKNDTPSVTFGLSHPLMTSAFQRYLEEMQSKAVTSSREETLALLNRYQ